MPGATDLEVESPLDVDTTVRCKSHGRALETQPEELPEECAAQAVVFPDMESEWSPPYLLKLVDVEDAAGVDVDMPSSPTLYLPSGSVSPRAGRDGSPALESEPGV